MMEHSTFLGNFGNWEKNLLSHDMIGDDMTREEIIAALNTEIHRLTSARDLLANQESVLPRPGRPGRKPAGSAVSFNPEEFGSMRRGGMSTEGRARVAEAQRKRWAQQKRQSARAASPAKKATASAKKVGVAAKSVAAKRASDEMPQKGARSKKVAAPGLAPHRKVTVKATASPAAETR